MSTTIGQVLRAAALLVAIALSAASAEIPPSRYCFHATDRLSAGGGGAAYHRATHCLDEKAVCRQRRASVAASGHAVSPCGNGITRDPPLPPPAVCRSSPAWACGTP